MMSLLEKKALVMYKQAEAKWGNRFSPLERERGAETGMSALATPYEYTGQRGDLLVLDLAFHYPSGPVLSDSTKFTSEKTRTRLQLLVPDQ